MSPLLDIHIRAKRFDRRAVLQNLRLSIEPGRIVSLIGASGCGKSTVLRIVAGLDRDFDGRLELDGRVLDGLSRDIGFVFQEPRLLPWLNVADNVAFDSGKSGLDQPRVTELLREVGLQGLERALPKQLSGGQAQRVAIARGLFRQPRLLLLDEPFSAVDAFTRMRLQDLLLEVARLHSTTLLMVTHDIDEAVYLSDRVVVLGEGRVTRDIGVPSPRPRDRRDPALAPIKSAVLDRLYETHAI